MRRVQKVLWTVERGRRRVGGRGKDSLIPSSKLVASTTERPPQQLLHLLCVTRNYEDEGDWPGSFPFCFLCDGHLRNGVDSVITRP